MASQSKTTSNLKRSQFTYVRHSRQQQNRITSGFVAGDKDEGRHATNSLSVGKPSLTLPVYRLPLMLSEAVERIGRVNSVT